ncbi:helix-turn-helix domain-containing protein [Pelagibius litoralis]|nr:helix-turn-helix domain-containing protein [Pelagibius litoralis]
MFQHPLVPLGPGHSLRPEVEMLPYAYAISVSSEKIVVSEEFSVTQSPMSLTTKEQLRAARAMLDWSQQDLADHSGVSLSSIFRLENGSGPLAIRLDTLQKLQTTLEKAGILFLPENGGGPGLRTRK